MKSTWFRRILPFVIILAAFTATLLYLVYVNRQDQAAPLQASGTVEAVEVDIAAELGGRVSALLVAEGQQVNAGDALLQIDDTLYQAQRARAVAALNLAQANLASAEAARGYAQSGLDAARASYEMTLSSARMQAASERLATWAQDQPEEISAPAWYFDRSEEITAARAEAEAARLALEDEEATFARLSEDLNSAEFSEAETRLAETQAAFLVASDVLAQAQAQPDEEIRTVAQDLYDSALADLEAAQSQYDRILSEKSAQDVGEARARLAVARQRHELAQDRLNALLTGEDSLAVQAALAAVQQAEAGLEQVDANILQAQRSVEQAQAEIDLVDAQIAKLTVYAPLDGVVLTCSVHAGEVIQPVASLMTLGQIDDLTITVYIAEDRYGEIDLGQTAAVSADSFPGETFEAEVIRIASQAEYTPRNVQTEEGRRTTVFAIQLAVRDPQGKLKPGMPADVRFRE